jgi:hypothetical protein
MPEQNREGEVAQSAKLWSFRAQAIAGLIAAVIPATAAVNGCYSLRLEREKFLSELHLKYVDRALDPTKDPTYRESFLTFIVDTTSQGDPLYHWAENRLENTKSIVKLREQVAAQAARLSQIADLLAKERAGHMQDKTVAAARERELRARAKVALREKLLSEDALRRAEAADGYRGTETNSSGTSSATDVSRHSGEFNMDSSYVQPGFVQPGFVGRSNEPKITSAYCSGKSSLRISGSRFGGTTGAVYVGFASASGVFGLPEKLSIRSWGDNEIDAIGQFPHDCATEFTTSAKKVWVQRSDTELSLPAAVVPGQ